MEMDDKFIKVKFASITPQTPAVNRPESKGRNGQIKTIGVEIHANEIDNLVRVSPITTRDAVSSACYVEFPFDKQTLEALADEFQYLAGLAPDNSKP